MVGGRLPTAWEITVAETLSLLDADFPEVARAVASGRYALWLGSGISLDRVVGVPAVIGRVIEFLRSNMADGNPTCRYKVALDQILQLLSEPEQACLHLDQPIEDWPPEHRKVVTCRLAESYSRVLNTPVAGEADVDFLLWKAVDVPGSFTGEDPDAEHLCVVMLTLEGAFRDISSANWDYLIEAAEQRLTGAVGSTIDVCIRAPDFQGAGGRAKLLKYHGCAVRAVGDQPVYRPLLIARTPQIQQYRMNAEYHVMRMHLVTTIQQRRTLMIGFSAQDIDVQDIFLEGAQGSGWNWTDDPKPFLFAEEDLKPGQCDVLASMYAGAYAANRPAIEAAARVRVYAKSLLIALLLNVLELKLAAFADLGLPATWGLGDRASLANGLRHIRDSAATNAAADRITFVHDLIAALSFGLDLFNNGRTDHGRYIPLSTGPLQQIGDVSVATGLRQASIALAVLGRGAADGDWAVMPDVGNAAPLKLDQAGQQTRLFFAANDDVAVQMIKNGHIDPDSDDTVLLLSASPKASRARNPINKYGRGSNPGLREVCMRTIIEGAADANDLMTAFKWGASL